MERFPEDVEAAVARGLGAYLRATPPRELPGELRRWRSFRPKALVPHRSELVAALEDDGLRGRVLEWLEDKKTLPKEEATALRLICERPAEWQSKLSSMSKLGASKRDEKPSAELELRLRLEREAERARLAREEARRAKEEGRRALAAEQKRAADLADELDRVNARLADEARAATAADKGAKKSVDAMERELRRARRDAEKATAAKDKLQDQLRRTRKEKSALARKVEELERKLDERVDVPLEPVAARRPGRKRVQLSPPKGLFEDSPEALREWLGLAGVQVLVDGYNVTKAEGGFGDLELEGQRDRLVDEVSRLARKSSFNAIVVFDSIETGPFPAKRSRTAVKVEYSAPHQTADDRLIALLKGLPSDPVIVVTNDRELQERARAEGATIATATQLLALLR